jgi:hypothetical protein
MGRAACRAAADGGDATLRLMPMGGAIGYRPAWPAYAYEFEDLIAQEQQGELERTQAIQNRTRTMPTLRAITAMERADPKNRIGG